MVFRHVSRDVVDDIGGVFGGTKKKICIKERTKKLNKNTDHHSHLSSPSPHRLSFIFLSLSVCLSVSASACLSSLCSFKKIVATNHLPAHPLPLKSFGPHHPQKTHPSDHPPTQSNQIKPNQSKPNQTARARATTTATFLEIQLQK